MGSILAMLIILIGALVLGIFANIRLDILEKKMEDAAKHPPEVSKD